MADKKFVSKSRSTSEDRAFKDAVAKQFEAARHRAEKRNISYSDFLKRLGITRAAYHKYITGKSIPSLRVIGNAARYFGVRLQYPNVDYGVVQTKRSDTRQLEFQFSLADITPSQIEVVKFSPKRQGIVELRLRINFSKAG